MISLVYVSLKLQSLNMERTLIFLLKKKMCVAFAFSAKNTCELNIVLTNNTVNILTTNELLSYRRFEQLGLLLLFSLSLLSSLLSNDPFIRI